MDATDTSQETSSVQTAADSSQPAVDSYTSKFEPEEELEHEMSTSAFTTMLQTKSKISDNSASFSEMPVRSFTVFLSKQTVK